MTKLVILVALVVLLWLAFRRARTAFLASPRGRELNALWRLLRQLRDNSSAADTTGRAAPSGRPGAAAPRDRAGRSGARPPTLLLPCAGCGTYVPESQILYGPGKLVFCSEDCKRRADAR